MALFSFMKRIWPDELFTPKRILGDINRCAVHPENDVHFAQGDRQN
jgi:hypothetical protein